MQSRSLKNTRLARAPNDLEAKPKTVSARCDLSALQAPKQTDFCLRRNSHISRTSADRKRKKDLIFRHIFIFFLEIWKLLRLKTKPRAWTQNRIWMSSEMERGEKTGFTVNPPSRMFTFCRHYLKVLEYSSSLEETTEPSALFPLTRRDFGFKTCFPQFPAIAAWKQMASSGREGGRRVRPRNAADELLASRWTGSQTLAVTKSRKEGRLHSQKIFEVFETNLVGSFSPSLSVVPRVLSVRFLFQREIIACEGPFSQSDRQTDRWRERERQGPARSSYAELLTFLRT